MKRIILFIGCLCFLCSITAQDRLLENSITPQQLQEVLQPTEKWVTYPAYTDRSAWTTRIPTEIRENIIKAGEKALAYEWKPDLATDYLAYKRRGEILTGRKNQTTLNTLVLAELVEGKGRFMDAIINGTWFLPGYTLPMLIFKRTSPDFPIRTNRPSNWLWRILVHRCHGFITSSTTNWIKSAH